MRLAYMVATEEVRGPRVTALRGSLEHNFARVAHAGFQGIELTVLDPTTISAAKILELADRHGLLIPAICTGEVYGESRLSFADPNPSVRQAAVERVLRILGLARALGANVNIGRVRGRFVPEVSHEQTMAWIADGLKHCANRYPDVEIMLEPINHKYSNTILTTAEAVAFLNELGLPNVRLQLDLVHMNVEEEDVFASLNLAAPLLAHIHVADSERKPPGLGNYDLETFINALIQINYDRWIAVEAWQEPSESKALTASASTLIPLVGTAEQE